MKARSTNTKLREQLIKILTVLQLTPSEFEGLTGLSKVTTSKIINGKQNNLSSAKRHMLCHALGVGEEWLLFGKHSNLARLRKLENNIDDMYESIVNYSAKYSKYISKQEK